MLLDLMPARLANDTHDSVPFANANSCQISIGIRSLLARYFLFNIASRTALTASSLPKIPISSIKILIDLASVISNCQACLHRSPYLTERCLREAITPNLNNRCCICLAILC